MQTSNKKTPARFSLRKMVAGLLFASVVIVGSLVAIDLYAHVRLQRYAGYNVWGYRGPVVAHKKPGELRVVVLGGSTAYGYGVHALESIPAYLEGEMRARLGPVPPTVVNLAFNNEGSYSFKFTLRDFDYLDPDIVIFYEGYNDLSLNRYVFRHDSAIFRATGYMPIFQIAFREKAATLLYGDVSALYKGSPDKTVFRPNLASRATAGALKAVADIGLSLDRQMSQLASQPGRPTIDATTGCSSQWQAYCENMFVAVDYVLAKDRRALVVTQPYMAGSARKLHMDQQTTLAEALERRYAANRRVAYANLGNAVNLTDPTYCWDGMHLNAAGNSIVAGRLVDSVLSLSREQ